MSDLVDSLSKEHSANGVASSSRRQLLAWGLGGAAALAFGVIGVPNARADIVDALGHVLDLDPVVSNFAFEMESLEIDFFERASLSWAYNQLSNVEQGVFNRIAMQDAEHRDMLKQLRRRHGWLRGGDLDSPNGSNPQEPRSYNFAGAFGSRDSLLKEAVHIKSLAVQSYHGSVYHISRSLLIPAAAIAGVEGRHLAVLSEMAGIDPVPSPFEEATSPQQTGRELGEYGFKGGDV